MSLEMLEVRWVTSELFIDIQILFPPPRAFILNLHQLVLHLMQL